MKKLKIIGVGLLLIATTGFAISEYGNPLQKPNQTIKTSTKCCKICKKGKACGDSCINKQLNCHKPKGCACDG